MAVIMGVRHTVFLFFSWYNSLFWSSRCTEVWFYIGVHGCTIFFNCDVALCNLVPNYKGVSLDSWSRVKTE